GDRLVLELQLGPRLDRVAGGVRLGGERGELVVRLGRGGPHLDRSGDRGRDDRRAPRRGGGPFAGGGGGGRRGGGGGGGRPRAGAAARLAARPEDRRHPPLDDADEFGDPLDGRQRRGADDGAAGAAEFVLQVLLAGRRGERRAVERERPEEHGVAGVVGR